MQNKNAVLDGIIRREFGDEKANMLIPQIGWLVRVKGETTK